MSLYTVDRDTVWFLLYVDGSFIYDMGVSLLLVFLNEPNYRLGHGEHGYPTVVLQWNREWLHVVTDYFSVR